VKFSDSEYDECGTTNSATKFSEMRTIKPHEDKYGEEGKVSNGRLSMAAQFAALRSLFDESEWELF